MKTLVESIIRSLTDAEDEVVVTETAADSTHIIEVKVAKADLGKVIGKKGKTADAIRTLVGCASFKKKKNYVLQILS